MKECWTNSQKWGVLDQKKSGTKKALENFTYRIGL